MKNIFTQHPHEVGEGYFEHMKFASQFGFSMMIGGLACVVHAILPFFFQKTASNVLLKMTETFIERAPKIEKRVLGLSELIEKKHTMMKDNNLT